MVTGLGEEMEIGGQSIDVAYFAGAFLVHETCAVMGDAVGSLGEGGCGGMELNRIG